MNAEVGTVQGQAELKCFICDEIFNTQDLLASHDLEKHKNNIDDEFNEDMKKLLEFSSQKVGMDFDCKSNELEYHNAPIVNELKAPNYVPTSIRNDPVPFCCHPLCFSMDWSYGTPCSLPCCCSSECCGDGANIDQVNPDGCCDCGDCGDCLSCCVSCGDCLTGCVSFGDCCVS